jgi:hypothetical protein
VVTFIGRSQRRIDTLGTVLRGYHACGFMSVKEQISEVRLGDLSRKDSSRTQTPPWLPEPPWRSRQYS